MAPGCSQTNWVRPGAASNMRTVASVGDKPLPSVSGEPGSSLRASVDDGARTASNGSRISGHVYDENGQPVPKAKVRLAVSSSPGGKINFATTDPSGGFTLRGLRPDKPYTVIAEYQGEDGLMTGRVEVEAPRTNVSISLQPRDFGPTQNRSAIRPAHPRVGPVSRPRPRDEDEETEDADNAKLNIEDLDLPSADSASLRPDLSQRTARLTPDSTAAVRAGWSVRQPASQGDKASAAKENETNTDLDSTSRAGHSEQADPAIEDDGPNPLPPAAESGRISSVSARDDRDLQPIRVARSPSRSATKSNRSGRTDQPIWTIPADVIRGPNERPGAPANSRGDPSRKP